VVVQVQVAVVVAVQEDILLHHLFLLIWDRHTPSQLVLEVLAEELLRVIPLLQTDQILYSIP
jgi:hypothetical protein